MSYFIITFTVKVILLISIITAGMKIYEIRKLKETKKF